MSKTAVRSERRGFTLIELLVVLAIIAVLAVLAVPAIQGLTSSTNLRSASDLLSGQLDLARQTASTQNLTVQVRLYQDSRQPQDFNGNYPYRLIAVVIPKTNAGIASDQFVTIPVSLAGDAIIDSDPQYSSIFNLPTTTASEATSAPALVQGMAYTSFDYQANGTINLSTANSNGTPQTWTLTLVNQHAKKPTTGTAPAANYVTLTLDPITGHVTTYQP